MSNNKKVTLTRELFDTIQKALFVTFDGDKSRLLNWYADHSAHDNLFDDITIHDLAQVLLTSNFEILVEKSPYKKGQWVVWGDEESNIDRIDHLNDEWFMSEGESHPTYLIERLATDHEVLTKQYFGRSLGRHRLPWELRHNDLLIKNNGGYRILTVQGDHKVESFTQLADDTSYHVTFKNKVKGKQLRLPYTEIVKNYSIVAYVEKRRDLHHE